MADPTDPIDLLVSRLADGGPGGAVGDLILAAALGDETLTDQLGGAPPELPPPQAVTVVPQEEVFLGEITVEGFRGIGPKTRLGLKPQPGLTIITGRNGSGKSSFAEAAELAFTGKSSRFEQRPKVWQEGWACLHHDAGAGRSIELRLSLSGQPGATVLRRKWQPNAGLAAATSTVQAPGGKELPADLGGWAAALATWRPFLSYNELGGLLDEGPSHLHDAVSAVLGLDEWTAAADRLDLARKRLDSDYAEARREAKRLHDLALGLDDHRAEIAVAALGKSDHWRLEVLESLVAGPLAAGEGIGALEELTRLSAVDAPAAIELAVAVTSASAALAELKGSDSGRADELAGLLEQALAFHRQHQQDAVCPVCGTAAALDADWVAATTSEVERLRREAAAVRRARSELDGAVVAAKSVVDPLPAALGSGAPGVDGDEVRRLWESWAMLPEDAADLAAHLTNRAPPMAEAVERLRTAALVELHARQDAWQPVGAQLAAWLPRARTAKAGMDRTADLKTAANWLRQATRTVRNERLEPIAGQVMGIWQMFCNDSNVSVTGVALSGTGTSRRVDVNVQVDSVDGAALSVMSQGELHALALAMFLPRATMGVSPFRFVVIDDPVQAMDFVRIDGLARVLSELASSRQVVVFTHDARLPDACRRLGIAATVLEVTRTQLSQVSIRSRSTPAENMLDDVGAVLATENMPAGVPGRVVPGICRRAVEATCSDLTWRRLLGEGRSHSEIASMLASTGKLLPRLALVLFGDAARGGDVLRTLNNRFGADAGDCVAELNRGSHEGAAGDLRNLADRTRKLIAQLDGA
ncbi:MAG: AAA family ATPase [Acidimicrobiales bacterium]